MSFFLEIILSAVFWGSPCDVLTARIAVFGIQPIQDGQRLL